MYHPFPRASFSSWSIVAPSHSPTMLPVARNELTGSLVWQAFESPLHGTHLGALSPPNPPHLLLLADPTVVVSNSVLGMAADVNEVDGGLRDYGKQ